MYVFFRLYHLLFQRFQLAFNLSNIVLSDPHDATLASVSSIEIRKAQDEFVKTDRARFEAFLSLIHGLVDGSIDVARYEDGCRYLLGAQSYMLFSLDRLIVQVLKELQLIINDITSCKLITLWQIRMEQKYQTRTGSNSIENLNADMKSCTPTQPPLLESHKIYNAEQTDAWRSLLAF
jgi:paired amphipathic helix protein Sin3a